ncbi:DUF1801 domain-containing protein [Mucilaginibacter myungsuensis]|uniref:DUF1801 domain-containing protein n=2 Tax=Mucilaginibacter myungsuensis TaxID=649104 RepID=A0A929PXW4_9SPHI|nr:DUF1801 domain-containing protein [Mucilaginibacter myungsuensis]
MKTVLNDASVTDFLDSRATDPQERADCDAIIDILQKVTGHPPKMWGDAIVGFDVYHYKYASGREADMCLLGFSPRKGKFSLYVLGDFEGKDDLLAKLGKHKVQGSCLHVKRLKDIDTDVLAEIARRSAEHTRGLYPNSGC